MNILMTKIDLENAKKLIEKNSEFKRYSSVFPFATENIDGYFKNIDFKNKNILSVCSSGDHALNSILFGAKNVDTFDRNILTSYYLKLKVAAILSLEYEEYLRYFLYYNKIDSSKSSRFFGKKTYNKIRENLNINDKTFWDGLYSIKSGYDIRSSKMFKSSEVAFKIMEDQNPYLKKDNYYKLKEKIAKETFNYFNVDLYNIKNTIENKKYDNIFLSNISSYLESVNCASELIRFKKFITENLSKNLNPGGKIFLAYIYRYKDLDNETEDKPCISNRSFREKILDGDSFEELEVDSARYNGKKDLVLSYVKNK